MGFRWFNFSSVGVANSTAAPATSNFASGGAVSDVLNETIYGASGMESFVWTGTLDVNTPSAGVSASASQVTDSGGDLLMTTTTANNFTFGLVVQYTTQTTLPTGLALVTNYYVVPITSTTFKLATSLANAVAGTFIAYTNTGTGNQTATPVALAGASIKLQGSNDQGATWADVPNQSQAITVDGSFVSEIDYVRYESYRTVLAMTSGQVNITKNQIGYKG